MVKLTVVYLGVSLILPFVLQEVSGWGLLQFFKQSSVREVCYKQYGCFDNSPPFTNTKGTLPQSPRSLAVRFLLYTRTNPSKARKLKKCGKKEKLLRSTRPTKIIIHGYMDKGRKDWVRKMRREILKNDDVNVIVVDWKRGAMTVNYLQAAANSRLVGAIAAVMVEKLNETYGITPSMIHIIGHSLGAHIAGYVGELIPQIARITGLDPAGPAFEDTDTRVRLDAADADFIDVIHTDTDNLFNTDLQPGFGTKQPMGDVDFYPNRGFNQPGCAHSVQQQFKLFFTGNIDLVENVACNHLRVLRLYTESINTPCQFKSYPCALEVIGRSDCASCGSKGCVNMGYHLDNSTNASGIYYLKTNDKSPFCLK